MANTPIARASLVATSCGADGRSWDVVVTNGPLSHGIIITDPFSGQQEVDLKWYLEDRVRSDPFAETRADAAEKSLEYYAQLLLEQLEPAFKEIRLDSATEKICLAISDRSRVESIHRLHWETLEHPVLKCNICVYRTQAEINVDISTRLPNKKTSLNLLFMTARSSDRKKADVDQRLILRPVLGFVAGMSSSTPVDFDVVRPGTFEALEAWLTQRKGHYDLVHFDVHGKVNKKNKRAELYFTQPEDLRKLQAVSAEKVGQLLQEAGIRVVVLNACESAVGGSGMAANLSLELLRCGISTVIGMSYILLIGAADVFMQRFYKSLLVEGTDILTSTWEARRALREERSRQSSFGFKVNVDDWIIPVFYTRRALVQNPSAEPILDIGDLPKIPPSEWNRAQSSYDIDGRDLVGRELDALLLENSLIKYKGFLHLFGIIGVGKTALLDDAVSWWLTTKYIRKHIAVNVSDFLAHPLATVINQLKDKVKKLSGIDEHSDADASLARAGISSRVPGTANDNILIVIDQAEDYLRSLDDDEKASFWKALNQFHNDINQLYPTLMIIASCCRMKIPDNQMGLEPLQKEDALNLAFQTSPKALERVRKSDYEKAYAYKLAQSLGGNANAQFFQGGDEPRLLNWGNPLALKVVFAALEQSITKSLSDVVLSTWTEGFPGQICEKSPGLKRHLDYFLSQSEDDVSKAAMTLLSPFRERVPKNLAVYFTRLIALEALPESLLGSTHSAVLSEAESSQRLDKLHKMIESVMGKLETAGFVIDSDRRDEWILHPLLPYILSPKARSFSSLNMEKVMNAHADSYMARTKEWKRGTSIATDDLKREYLNFISSFWRLSNPNGISIGTRAPWYLVNFVTSYDLGDDLRNPDMVIAVALCEETIACFQKSTGDWERSLTADLIYKPSSLVSESIKDDEHRKSNCTCWSLIALITLADQVQSYHLGRTADENFLLGQAKRLVDLWSLHQKHFTDDFHCQRNCGVGGYALFQAGSVYSSSHRLLEALELQTRAKKLLEDNLVINPMFKYQLELCKADLAKTELLIANHGAIDPAASRLHDEKVAQIVDEMWASGPDGKKPIAWSDAHTREEQAKRDPSLSNIIAIITKDIREPGSEAEVLQKLRQTQLKNLQSETQADWIPGQIQSKSLMALAATRTKDWKQAIMLYEDIIALTDQVEYGSDMKRSLMKLEYHHSAAQAAISGNTPLSAITHLQEEYTILRRYKLLHDTRYSMFRLLNLAEDIPPAVPFQLGTLTPAAQALEMLTLLYDPTILDCEEVRKKSQNLQDAIRAGMVSRMNGRRFRRFWEAYCWDDAVKNFKPGFAVTGQEIMVAIGAKDVEFGRLCFGDFWKGWWRIPAEVPNVANQRVAYDILWREFERTLFAPPELRKDFRWLDKKYEEQGLRQRWPKGFDDKAEAEMKQGSTTTNEPATNST